MKLLCKTENKVRTQSFLLAVMEDKLQKKRIMY